MKRTGRLYPQVVGRDRLTRSLFTMAAVTLALAAITGCEPPVGHDGSPDQDAPSEVGDLSATEAGTGVSLAWSNPADSDVDRIEISWSPEDGESQPTEVDAGDESATITGLAHETEYTFTVKTVDSAGNSSAGATVSATTLQKQKWSFETDVAVQSSPAIGADGTVYVGASGGPDGYVYALDPDDGDEKWSVEAEGSRWYSSPAIGADGTVYVGSYFGSATHNVYALDPDDGDEKWRFETEPGEVESSPAIGADGTVYVGSNVPGDSADSDDGTVYALDADGNKKWNFETGGGMTSSPAIGADGTVYVGSDDGTVYALDPANGEEKWNFETRDGVALSPAIGADGTVYIGFDHGTVYALDDDGLDPDNDPDREKWRFEPDGNYLSSPAIGADGTVYVGASDGAIGYVYALDPDNGREKWSFETKDGVASSPAIGADGTVYIGSVDHYVYALDPDDGTEEWSLETGDQVTSSPAIGADGTVYVGSYDDNVYALNGAGGGLADSPWPMFGRDPQHTGRVPRE